MPNAKIVITEFMDEAVLEQAGDGYDMHYDPTLVDDLPRLLALLGDARAMIVRNRTQVTADLLGAAPALRVIGRLGVGLDNIDLAACAARGVAVRPATGANADAVAEYVIAAAMILTRRAFGATDAMLAGDWPRNAMIGGEVSGRRLGLLGFGDIARAVAARARALGMRVIAHDPFVAPADPCWADVTRADRAELIRTADVLSLHVPLTSETSSMIDAEAIASMKPGTVLINTSRGGIVDETALAAALRDGQVGGAALDVFQAEPLDAAAARAWHDVPNLLLTPHIAGLTEESNLRVSRETVRNVLEELQR